MIYLSLCAVTDAWRVQLTTTRRSPQLEKFLGVFHQFWYLSSAVFLTFSGCFGLKSAILALLTAIFCMCEGGGNWKADCSRLKSAFFLNFCGRISKVIGWNQEQWDNRLPICIFFQDCLRISTWQEVGWIALLRKSWGMPATSQLP